MHWQTEADHGGGVLATEVVARGSGVCTWGRLQETRGSDSTGHGSPLPGSRGWGEMGWVLPRASLRLGVLTRTSLTSTPDTPKDLSSPLPVYVTFEIPPNEQNPTLSGSRHYRSLT